MQLPQGLVIHELMHGHGHLLRTRGGQHALAQLGVTHIVNATDDMPNFFESDAGGPAYLRFNIAAHMRASSEADTLLAFVAANVASERSAEWCSLGRLETPLPIVYRSVCALG